MRTHRAGRLAVATLLLSGCDLVATECTEIGCVDQVVVSFEPLQLRPGHYLLRLAAPDDEVVCDFTLPAEPNAPIECSREPFAMLYLSGPTTLASIEYWATPETLTVELSRDALQLMPSQPLRPAYQTSRPNGEACEPICESANVSIDLPALVDAP